MPATPPVVHSDPDVLGGTPVFLGTRVPVQTLFDYLEGGETLDEFLRQFPSVSRGAGRGGACHGQGDPSLACASCLTRTFHSMSHRNFRITTS